MGERTLDEVLATVDATVLRRAAGPAGDIEVGDVVILDWTDPDALPPAALVLAVGVEADGPAATGLIERAGAAGAAAVVLRSEGHLPADLAAAVERAGVVVLTAPLGVAWGQLYALLRTALSSAGPNSGQGGTQGVVVGDLFSLADAIATAVGGPVTIEDPQWRVLAYSNLDQEIDEARRQTILGRTPPPEWQQRLDDAGVGAALRRGDGVVRFDAEGLATRLVAPIRAGGELLGSIWLAVGERPLASGAEDQLLRAGELAAMHLVAHRASDDVKRRARGASVREVLEGQAPAGHRAPTFPLSVIAFGPREDGDAWLSSAERVLSVVALFAEAAHREATCALVDERIWALVPTPATRPAERLVEIGERVAGRVGETLDLPLLAVVGPAADALSDVPGSRAAAERALGILTRRRDAAPVTHIDAMRAEVVLDELLELADTRPSLRGGPLAALAEVDRDGSRLATLRAYLDAHGDAGVAARRLDIHPNTLRYRLRRVVELTGLDLTDPDERLVAELQLRLVERD